MTNPSPQIITRGNPGRRLERARREAGLTRKDVADRLKVPTPVVKHFDLWQLDSIEPAYRTKSVIRYYALLVGLNPSAYEALIPYEPGAKYRFKPLIVLSRLSLSTLAALAGVLIVGFLAWQTFVAAAKPKLDIGEPAMGLVADQATTAVSGRTSSQAQVYVNGFNVPVDPSGSFRTVVILQPGANTITITAINSFGRQSQTSRIVQYHGE